MTALNEIVSFALSRSSAELCEIMNAVLMSGEIVMDESSISALRELHLSCGYRVGNQVAGGWYTTNFRTPKEIS